MTNFKKFAPVVALAFALSPFAASAVITQVPAQKPGYLSGTAISQFAANAKFRPAACNTATKNRLAENSKGRPAEFASSTPEIPLG